MTTENTGAMLRGVFGYNDPFTPIKEAIQKEETSFPKIRRNAVGMRIDLCGEVETFTNEYTNGWRFFDSHSCLYKQEGEGTNPHHSLVSTHPDYDLASILPKPASCYQWVHPHHLLTPVFSLISASTGLTAGGHYINRMGFVITLEGSPTDVPSHPMVRDLHGNLYYTTGRRSYEHLSMYDLAHEIVDWPYFSKSDWSEIDVKNAGPEPDFRPESYDPAATSHENLLREFYDHLGKAHALGKKLNAGFTFNIDSTRTK